MTRTRILFPLVAAAAAIALAAGTADAKDKVRLVDSQAMVFAHFGIYHAQNEGFFAAENLDASVIIGRGGSDALQAVVTGSQDMVMFPGILSVIAAYAKGAPITIVASGCLGAPETFWYVKNDSQIKSFKDLNGRDLVYSSPGSLSHLTAQTLAREAGVIPKYVAVGTFATSRTQMMSGQSDTAFTGLPANYDIIRKGEARMIGSGRDSPMLNGMTTRVVVANSAWLANNRDVAVRTLRALWKGHQFNFTVRDKAVARYAEHWKVDLDDAKQVYDFYTIDHVRFAPVLKLEESLQLAKDYGFIKEPLTAEQKKGLVTAIYDPGR